MIKLLQTGHALASIVELKKHGLHRGVFPVLDVALDEAQRHDGRESFVRLALADTDARVAEGKPVAPSFMLAAHAVARRAGRAGSGARRAGEDAVPGAAGGDRRRLRRAHRRHLRPRQARRRHARDLDDAAALRAARRQLAASAARAAALSRRLRFPAPARRGRRGRPGARGAGGKRCTRPTTRSAATCSTASARRAGRGASSAKRRARRRRPGRWRTRLGRTKRGGATLPERPADATSAAMPTRWAMPRPMPPRREAPSPAPPPRRFRRHAELSAAMAAPTSAVAATMPSSASAPTSATARADRGAATSSLPLPMTTRVARSALYRTAPLDAAGGRLPQRRRRAGTALAPLELLRELQAIESRHGRDAAVRRRAAHARPRPAALRRHRRWPATS